MNLSERWATATSWALTRFTEKPVARGKAVAIIASLVLVIGVADCLLGIQISLFIFYLVPVCLAVAWLGVRAAVATTAAAIAVRILGDLISIDFRPLPFWTWWHVLAGTLTFGLIIWILNALISLHRDLEQRVRERTRALHEAAKMRERLQRELLDIGARERSAIGRELHDELCQHLVGTALAAQVLRQRLEGRGDIAAQDARDIVKWVEDGIAKTRQIARGLLLSGIEPDELGRELGELAAASSRAGITCRFRQEGTPGPGDASAAAQLLRIAQEATRNALRHARARHVDITLAGDERSTCLMVEDDGNGLPPAQDRGGGMGLRIMEHRATLAGGTLSVITKPGEGTRIICRLQCSPEIA
jgi:signal transduction histidine kinase